MKSVHQDVYVHVLFHHMHLSYYRKHFSVSYVLSLLSLLKDVVHISFEHMALMNP